MTEYKTSPHEIPMSSPDLTNAERTAVNQVMQSQYLSMGKEILAFEQAIMTLTGCRFALAVNSGTAGLHLCVRAAGIAEGDLVITTPFSFVASSNVLLYEKAIPIFVDVDPATGNINPELIHQAASDLSGEKRTHNKWLPRQGIINTGRLKAILPVDVFGQPAEYEPILETARSFNLKIIEDSCEALGAEYKNRKAGSWGDYGIFAFYPNKQITTGEGGVVITNDAQAAMFMSALRNQGRAPGDTWLQHTFLGYNYRLNELSAALGRVQLTRLDELMQKRYQVARWYTERLMEIPTIESYKVSPNTTRMSWFVYVIRFIPSINRDKIAQELSLHGIPTRPYFQPIHLQPYMIKQFGFQPGDFPVAEDLGNRSLALPFSGVMTENQVDIVCDTLRKVLLASFY